MLQTALAIYLACTAAGGHCLYQPDARVTEYAPLLGGINCSPPCDVTASGALVDYGVTAACGPSIPFMAHVFIDGVGWRVCHDRGGAIDDAEIDVAVLPADLYRAGINGRHGTVWVLTGETLHDIDCQPTFQRPLPPAEHRHLPHLLVDRAPVRLPRPPEATPPRRVARPARPVAQALHLPPVRRAHQPPMVKRSRPLAHKRR